MTEKEALIRVKTRNFNDGYGFDMQLLIDTVGIIGEMLKSGQLSEIVRCKDCKHSKRMCQPWYDLICEKHGNANTPDWFCADEKRRDDDA